jgi:hypothetical protein
MIGNASYLMAGGAPAGINILPGEEGCLTKSTSMRMMTMQGKRMTTPSGTEMLEFPLNLNGLRKNASREANVCGRGLTSRRFSSAVGSWGVALATSLLALWNRSILCECLKSAGSKAHRRRLQGFVVYSFQKDRTKRRISDKGV